MKPIWSTRNESHTITLNNNQRNLTLSFHLKCVDTFECVA